MVDLEVKPVSDLLKVKRKAEKLERRGRYSEAGKLYQEIKQADDAVRCYLKAGLEDRALKVAPEEYSVEAVSKQWQNYILSLDRNGKRMEAMRCMLTAAGRLYSVEWEMLMKHFDDKACDKNQWGIWAEIRIAHIERQRGDYGLTRHEKPNWKEALSFLKAGNKEKAFEIFDRQVEFEEVDGGWSTSTLGGIPCDPLTKDDKSLWETIVRKYLEANNCRKLGSLEGWFHDRIPYDLLREVIKSQLVYQGWWKEILGRDGEFLKGAALYRAQQAIGIGIAGRMYLEAGKKDVEIEETIISYAEKIEHYDAVVFSLEQFGRLDEAVRYLEETPAHLIWPDSDKPEEESKRYKEKLEYKLKRMRKTAPDKAASFDKDELARMLALGEITKEEYDKMKRQLESGTSGTGQ